MGQVIGMRIDEVTMPGGAPASREIVEHLGAVAVVALDDDDAVTLIYQYRHPLGRRLWELPAGLLDHSKENPAEAAKRELVEEAGLVGKDWATLVDIAPSAGFTDQSVRIYLARGLSDTERDEVLGNEETDLVIRKFPLSEAVQMVFSGELVEAASVAGILATSLALGQKQRLRPVETPWRDRPTKFAARREQ